MSARLAFLAVVIAGFGVLSCLALRDAGYIGIVALDAHSWAGAQILADLVILAVLACRWMIRDAPGHGLAAWPYVALTVVAGSFGPLFYLVARHLRAQKNAASSEKKAKRLLSVATRITPHLRTAK